MSEDVSRPSVRVAGLEDGERAAIAKNREERYDSVGDLAADVERHLTDQAVNACPPDRCHPFHLYNFRSTIGTTLNIAALQRTRGPETSEFSQPPSPNRPRTYPVTNEVYFYTGNNQTEVHARADNRNTNHRVPNIGIQDGIPDVMSENSHRFTEFLARALEVPADERTLFIEDNCADPDLRAELIELFAKEAELGAFLERPAARALKGSEQAPPLETGRLSQPTARALPETVGPFRIRELLGEGGMGVVYLAEQDEPVKRELAIKVVRAELTDKNVYQRFAAERQALARLSHPYIAQMYEAGTTEDGFPYFAMELVRGVPITKYCDRSQKAIEERLKLFVQVCQGVQHAHQRGIIHRDLKPSNILVAEVEGRPVPKLIDFGIAKALDRPLTDITQLTGLDAIGTPAYMSPESLGVDGDALDLDTRTDVYALGVVLYELLAGVRPFESTGSSVAQVVHRMMSEDAPRLSIRAAGVEETGRSEISELRGLTADTLPRRLAGDLDWITALAMAKERDQRYGSAAELGEDIERHLSNVPVKACPPSLSYRTGKFARRHRAAAAAILFALIALIIGVIGLGAGLVRAKRAEAEAQNEAKNAQQTIELLEQFLASANPANKGKDLMVRDLLQAFIPQLNELQDRPLIQARLLQTYGKTYHGLGLHAESYSSFNRAFDLRSSLLGKDHPDTLLSLNGVAQQLCEQGKYDEAELLSRQCNDAQKRVLGEEHQDTLRSLNIFAIIVTAQGKWDEAELLHQHCLELRQQVLGREHPDTLQSVNSLAGVFYRQGKYVEAEPLYRQCLEAQKRVLGEEHPNTLASLNNLAGVLHRQTKYAESEELNRRCLEVRRRVLGEEHPNTLKSLNYLASSLGKQGKYEEAEQLHRQCADARKRIMGEEHPQTLASLNNLANVVQLQGRFAEAELLYREFLEVQIRVQGEENAYTLGTQNNLSMALGKQGKYEEAERLHRTCFEAIQRVLGKDHPNTFAVMSDFAENLSMAAKHQEAETLNRKVFDYRRRTLGPHHTYTVLSMINLDINLLSQDKLSEARDLTSEILDQTSKDFQIDSDTVDPLFLLGKTLARKGMNDEALQFYRRAANAGHKGAQAVLGDL